MKDLARSGSGRDFARRLGTELLRSFSEEITPQTEARVLAGAALGGALSDAIKAGRDKPKSPGLLILGRRAW